MPTLSQNEPQYSTSVSTLLEELGKRYPMQVNAQRYRDNQRFVLLLQNGFQEIDKVQGFHQRKGEAGAHAWAPIMGHKETHTSKGPDMVYESCFIALTKGVYPSLKNVENDVRGVIGQKEAQGVISNPTTVLPPAAVVGNQTQTVDNPVRAPPSLTGQQPTSTGQQPIVTGQQQPIVTGQQQPIVTGQQPIVTGQQQPIVTGQQQPVLTGQQPHTPVPSKQTIEHPVTSQPQEPLHS